METDKKNILLEQVQKLEEVIQTLSANFDEEDIADEVNFLHIVKQNLEEWSEREING